MPPRVNGSPSREKKVLHTLSRWPRATVISTSVLTIIATTPSTRGLSSARRFTRGLGDPDALRCGRRCRVLWFDGSRLFAFLLSLNCLRHKEPRTLEGKEWTRSKRGDWGRGNVVFEQVEHCRDLGDASAKIYYVIQCIVHACAQEPAAL